MKQIKLLLLTFIIVSGAKAQDIPALSSKAEISILTCAPGDELYEAFGHSAIRINEPGDFDIVYNYGIFSYSSENFYLNFAKGFLWYRLGVSRFDQFIANYSGDGRQIIEQVLNLDSIQKHDLFAYLEWNRLPEYANYKYHYFDDNCATRLMFVLDSVKSINVTWHDHPSQGYRISSSISYVDNFGLDAYQFEIPKQTYRDMVVRYTANDYPWMKLGIDMCQGLPVDREITDVEYSFLPDYFMLAVGQATISKNDEEVPLVAAQSLLNEGKNKEKLNWLTHPTFILNALWMLLLLLSYYGYKFAKPLKGLDYFLLVFTGLLGVFFLIMWFLTEHYHCDWNLNVLWASPINLIAAFALNKAWIKKYFKFYAWLQIVILLSWFFVFPQNLHEALFGLVVLLAYRSWNLAK